MEVHPKTGLTFWYSFGSHCMCLVCYTVCVCVLRFNFMHSKWYDSVLPWCFEIYFTFLFSVSVCVCCCCLFVVTWKNPFGRRLNFFLSAEISCLNILYTLRFELRGKKAMNETTNRRQIMLMMMTNSTEKKFCSEIMSR